MYLIPKSTQPQFGVLFLLCKSYFKTFVIHLLHLWWSITNSLPKYTFMIVSEYKEVHS